jgi:serine/threonine protein kinase
LNLVLKDNPINRNVPRDNDLLSSTRVSINGGTGCYQAPELFKKNAKFSRRADVFAAGVVFLELLTLQKPNSLWDDIYPGILNVKLPAALLKCLSSSLDPDPRKRIQFKDLLVLLRSQDGISIGELELGSPASKYTFDEVAADIHLMMPSSQYDYESSSGNQSESMSDVEGNYISSSARGVNDLEPKGMFSPVRRYFKK